MYKSLSRKAKVYPMQCHSHFTRMHSSRMRTAHSSHSIGGACMAEVCMMGAVHDRGEGCAWQGGVHGRGHVWQGACMPGGLHGGGHTCMGMCMGGGARMYGGCACMGACMGGRHACLGGRHACLGVVHARGRAWHADTLPPWTE